MSDFDCDPLFSRIYLEMLEQMTAYSARRLGDIGLAEDVAQDTFAECWKNWEQGQRVKHHPNPRGWLWEALKIKLKKMREDMEKVRTVPLDELAHPPAAPVERRLYLSDYLPPDTSRADRRIVRLRLEEMTDQSCDPELIRLYLDVLEEKEPLGLELDPEASLQRFLEERAGEESRSTPPEEPAAQAAVSRPAGLRRFRHFPRTLIAAAVVAVLFGLGSMAGSSRLWESVVHLTQGTLQIVPPGASQSGQTSAQPPLEELEFTSLQEALDAYGIAEPLVPKWLPEGFESLGVTTNVDPDFIRIAETYSYDEKKIKIMIRRYNSEEALDKVSVEKEDEQQDVKYIRGGVEHSVAQNRSIYTASWTNGLNVVSIIGDMTEEELEQMIDSIYT